MVYLRREAKEAHMKSSLAALTVVFGLMAILTGPAHATQKVNTTSLQPKIVNASTPNTAFSKHCVTGAHYKTATITMRKAGGK
jgi:type VI protein secretion system component Hcp